MSVFDPHRRHFLQRSAQAAAAALLAPSITRALSIPAAHRTGTLQDVEHIVVFMQENRSFDHYFGTLAGVRGFADPHPAPLPGGETVWRQPDGRGGVVAPFRFDVNGTRFPVMKSLPHDWYTGHAAWNGGRYDGWVAAKGGLALGYLTRDDIPYHFALADAFTVCDAYFASLQGPTCPNRLYLMTGGIDHGARGGGPVTDCSDATQCAGGKVFNRTWTTYAERLQRAGVSWRVYRQGEDVTSDDDSDGGMNTLLAFEQFRSAQPGEALYEFGVRPRRLEVLKADVMTGRLPQVSWIIPPRLFCEHPKWPPSYGALYLARILDALTANPAVWSKTVLLVMYDENDGFFDHVVPPAPPLTRAEGLSSVPVDDERHPVDGLPYGLGMRVPMLAISPWSRGGWVCSQVFDHTSVIRFMEARFGVREDNISVWRRTVCGDLTSAFDFRTPNTAPPAAVLVAGAGVRLPNQATYDAYRVTLKRLAVPSVPAASAPPVIEHGLRRARALPYDFAVDARVSRAAVHLTFASLGGVGAAFYVRDMEQRAMAPRRYTVAAGATLADRWTAEDGRYRLRVEGPNGFLRLFAGHTAARGLEVHARAVAAAGEMSVYLHNGGHTSLRVAVTDHYSGATRSVEVAAGATLKDSPPLTRHWYDVSYATGDWLRRLAGRVETGAPGVSDPAMGGTTAG